MAVDIGSSSSCTRVACVVARSHCVSQYICHYCRMYIMHMLLYVHHDEDTNSINSVAPSAVARLLAYILTLNCAYDVISYFRVPALRDSHSSSGSVLLVRHARAAYVTEPWLIKHLYRGRANIPRYISSNI